LDGDSCSPLCNVSTYARYRTSIAHCQGRLLRCGETSTQLPRSRLNLRCEMSFKMGSDMAGKRAAVPARGSGAKAYYGLHVVPRAGAQIDWPFGHVDWHLYTLANARRASRSGRGRNGAKPPKLSPALAWLGKPSTPCRNSCEHRKLASAASLTQNRTHASCRLELPTARAIPPSRI
jgi:hypothetical protein